jgi:hypothetical protein
MAKTVNPIPITHLFFGVLDAEPTLAATGGTVDDVPPLC